jgi:hypothetical protein
LFNLVPRNGDVIWSGFVELGWITETEEFGLDFLVISSRDLEISLLFIASDVGVDLLDEELNAGMRSLIPLQFDVFLYG